MQKIQQHFGNTTDQIHTDIFGIMENEDKYEPPTVLNDVTDTVTFNEIHDADVTGVSDKYPDVTDVSDKYPDVTDVSDTFPHVSDVNDKYPDVTDVSGNYSDEDESDKYNIGRDFDDGEVNESSSLTDEESEWTAENESPLLSNEHDERDTTTNPSSTRMQGHLLNTHPTEDTCETEMCISVTHHPAYKKCNHVPYKTTRSIPPEGGTSGNVVLINTRCIDSVLLMIYTVLDYDHYHRNRFKDSDNELEKISFEVWNSFKENNFGIGKVMWCFCGGSVSLAEMNSGRQIRVDITGTENQRIFSVLGKHRLDVECRCTNQDCPYPVMKQTERYRVLPIYATERELLSDTISKGIKNFLWRDMGLCTNSQSDGEKCSGTRRQSIVEPPFILPVNLYFLHFGGKTFNSSDIPEKVEHNNLIYDLRLVRFYRDKHFVDKIKVDGVWTYYDNGHGQLYYFDADLKGAELSTCYYIKRRQNL